MRETSSMISRFYLKTMINASSMMDLSLTDSNTLPKFEWSNHYDIGGSDHFTTTLTTINPADKVERYKGQLVFDPNTMSRKTKI